MIIEFADASFGEHAKVARKHIKVAIKNEARKRREAKKVQGDRRKRWRYARELLLAPIARQDITTDAEVLADPATRVLSRSQFDAIARDDTTDDQRRATVVSTSLSSREELLVS